MIREQQWAAASRGRLVLMANNRIWSTTEIRVLLKEAFGQRFTSPERMRDLAICALSALETVAPSRRRSDLRAQALGLIGNAHRVLSQFQPALLALDAAEDERLQGTSAKRLAAMLLEFRASLLESMRLFEEAGACLAQALKIRESLMDRAGMAKLGLKVGAVLSHGGRSREAIPALIEALDNLRGDRLLTVAGVMSLAWCLADVGQPQRALWVIDRARVLLGDVQPLLAIKVRWIRGRIMDGLGRSREGTQYYESAREGYVLNGMVQEAALVTLDIALLYLKAGDWTAGSQEAERAATLLSGVGGQVEGAAAKLLAATAARGGEDPIPALRKLAVLVRQSRPF
jgi:tetratricopeptide (TPR) repeat protein